MFFPSFIRHAHLLLLGPFRPVSTFSEHYLNWSHPSLKVSQTATIVGRPGKDEFSAYVAQICHRGHGFQELLAFSMEKIAKTWVKLSSGIA